MVEGKLSKGLKKVLRKVVAADLHEQLAVADTKLGGAIKVRPSQMPWSIHFTSLGLLRTSCTSAVCTALLLMSCFGAYACRWTLSSLVGVRSALWLQL